jgi:hypothetical protein
VGYNLKLDQQWPVVDYQKLQSLYTAMKTK